jgi:threonine synthase
MSLTSANSINIARWLPQQFYYFFALQQWEESQPPVICVPSGNFGNICAGLLAYRSGLPVSHFIAACNSNKTFPNYLDTGKYAPGKAVATYSNAMDVSDPSNFVRLLELFGHDFPQLSKAVSSASISDASTAATIKKVFEQEHYLLEPHGAVAYQALEEYLESHSGQKGILLETAHPVKFVDVVEKYTGKKVEVPASVQQLASFEKKSILIEQGFGNLKDFLMGRDT